MDEKPERVWIHPNLKKSLIELSNKINEESIRKTGYPIPKGVPLSSKIASFILDNLLNKEDLITIDRIEKQSIFNTHVSSELKYPLFFLIIDPRENILWDKSYFNLSLFKKRGIKENEINFI